MRASSAALAASIVTAATLRGVSEQHLHLGSYSPESGAAVVE